MGKLARKDENEPERAGLYFLAPAAGLQFFSSGCTLLDCVLGGGWVLGRMSNIIGDKSTAKTALAIESAANFARRFPKAPILYREAEGAFDRRMAIGELGFPKAARLWEDDYDDRPLETVEDIFEDLDAFLNRLKAKEPALYIVDSLDALSDRDELKREIDKGSYSMTKQKKLGELFRRLVRRIEASNVALLIVSQVRDNIGVMFGEKYRRNGGKAMDFYASHCIWLAPHGHIEEKHRNVERTVAINVRARAKKNKVGMPFREVDFVYRLGFGVDDVATSLNWLAEVKRLDVAELKKKEEIKELMKELERWSDADYRDYATALAEAVTKLWYEMEKEFLPTRRKYA